MAGINQFKCPACGGSIEFNAATQKMKCPYCETEFDMKDITQQEEAVGAETVDAINWDETSREEWSEEESAGMAVYSCNSCGGEIVGDENLGATSCPYCGSQVVMSGKFSGALRPDYIIPFKMDKEKAKENYLSLIKKNKYIPKNFKNEKHIEEFKGVYVPFWLFDADIDAEVEYNVKYEERTTYSNYTEVEEEKYEVYRKGIISFRNVPVDGSSKIEDDLMESIEPFNFDEAVPFSKAYLAGFMADKYDVNKDNSIDRANERMKKGSEWAFRNTIPGIPESVSTVSSEINTRESRAKYALYPVWLLSAKYAGKAYTFAMNGQTGKFAGNLPIDNGALWRYFGKATAIIGGIVFAISMAALTL